MKKVFLSLICLTLLTVNLMADQHIASQATDVTIFLSGAQVTRQPSVKLTQGKQTVVFTGLSANLNANSIQVSADQQVTILGVKREYDFSEKNKVNERVAEIESQIKAKELEISKLKNEQEIIVAEQNFLNANSVLSGKNEAVNLAALQQTLNYYRERLQATKARQLELDLLLKERQSELNTLKSELKQVQGRAGKKTSNIIVEVSAKQAGTYNFKLNYYVSNVSWSAAYDLRAFSLGEPIALTYKALVSQNTGEDWKNVNLTLSSGNPTESSTKPSLSTYRLREPQPIPLRASKAVYMRAAAMPAPMAMEESAMADYIEEEADNMVATEVSDNMTAFEIRIKEKYNIPSTSEKTTVDVGIFSLPTTYEYHAVPKKDKDAFLIAKATDWTRYHLINGSANIYFENTFVGQTDIDTYAANDTLTVSLGRDKSIVVTREALTDYNKTKFLSSKQEVTKSWELTVKNQKAKEIDIIVYDQIPVSSDSQIEISQQLDGGVLKTSTGEVTWKLHLLPNSSTKKTLTYTAKFPKDWSLYVE